MGGGGGRGGVKGGSQQRFKRSSLELVELPSGGALEKNNIFSHTRLFVISTLHQTNPKGKRYESFRRNTLA